MNEKTPKKTSNTKSNYKGNNGNNNIYIPKDHIFMKTGKATANLKHIKSTISETNEAKRSSKYNTNAHPYRDEFDAFQKYYEKIKDNNSVLEVVHLADMLAFTTYCDLYDSLKPNLKAHLLNPDHRPFKKSNDKILYASPLVYLKENAEKGRHLVAHCQINKNEVIVNEKATILQVNPFCSCTGTDDNLYRCHECAKICSVFYTCNTCNIAVFCSLECLKSAYTVYHRFECDGLQKHFWSIKESDYSYIAFRMMLYGCSVDFNITPNNDNCYGNSNNNYPYIYGLQTNFYQMPIQKIHEILDSCTRTMVYLMVRTNFFKQFNLKDEEILCSDVYQYIGGLLLRHYCQAQMNNILLKFPNVARGFGFNIPSALGKAICPTISLINHSCSPNAVIIAYNNYIVVRAIKPIETDEEITVCYSEINAFMTVDDRQLIMEELFYFTCKCKFCKFERTWEQNPYKCPLCPSGKAKKIENDGIELGYCITCEQTFKINSKDEKLAAICKKLMILDKNNFDLNHMLRIAECYSTLYPSDSWMLLDVYKVLYQKYSIWGAKPIETIKYGILSFNILEQYIPRLYMPLLEAKIRFYLEILHDEKFCELERITDCENDTLKIFHAEILKTKKDLLFYVPAQHIDFYYVGILDKLEQIQSNLMVTNVEELQEPKSR